MTGGSRASPLRRGRVSRACAHCKQRKLRCSGDLTGCRNCDLHEVPCEYPERSRRVRPTNAAILQLQEENRRLKQGGALQDSGPGSHGEPSGRLIGAPASSKEVDGVEKQTQMRQQTMVHSPGLSPNILTATSDTPHSANASTYHGPTSTLFDDAVAKSQARPWLSAEREALMPKLLLAAAAEQRQMESINARAGKLDFDGVEPELGLHLLNLHWNRQHHSFLVTYRPAFMRDMACAGPYFSRILLNSIYFGASKFSPRLELRKDVNDVRTAGWHFRNRVRDLLGEALDRSEITTIQALLQMSNSLFALGDEQSAAWVYAGTAFRMITDLGLHVDVAALPNLRRLTDEDIEIRRRVFWAAFVVDKIQSLYQGRPASLRATECQVPILFLDTYEELEYWTPFAYTNDDAYAGSASWSVSTFAELCRLCLILADILDSIYSGKQADKKSLTEDLRSLDMRLNQWKEVLPEHLNVSPGVATSQLVPPPHVLSLLAMWNVLRILLHRPFVSDGHLHSVSPSVSVTSFSVCAAAATNIVNLVRLYDAAFTVRRAPYLISYAIYVAATIHVRIAANSDSKSEAHGCLSTCLTVFQQNAETNYAVRKASLVITNMMAKMNVTIEQTNSQDAALGSNFTAGANSSNDWSQHGGSMGALDARSQDDAGGMSSYPTLAAGRVAPDLDIDAIIQSFMQDQQAPNGRHASASSVMDGRSHGHLDHSTYGQQWSGAEVSLSGITDVNDILFGFNTSDFDWHNMSNP